MTCWRSPSRRRGGYLIPAHAWTPWFAVLGSQSGFDRVSDCYADLAEHIFAIETGLSSDPEMNWRVSSLDQYRLVSNSDAHSPPMLGREATLFDTATSATRPSSGRCGPGTASAAPSSSSPKRASTTWTATAPAECGPRRQETRAAGGKCPVCGKTADRRRAAPGGRRSPTGPRATALHGAAGFRSFVPAPGDHRRDRRRRPQVQVGDRPGRRPGRALRPGAVHPRRRAAGRAGREGAVHRGRGHRPAAPRRRPPGRRLRRRLRDDPPLRPRRAGLWGRRCSTCPGVPQAARRRPRRPAPGRRAARGAPMATAGGPELGGSARTAGRAARPPLRRPRSRAAGGRDRRAAGRCWSWPGPGRARPGCWWT